jgi:uncharacterized membrane protein YphA (DoxX/SURF4 family)
MTWTIANILQVIMAGGLLNVWLLRFNKQTPFRGGSSKSIIEEFASYGLPAWFSYLVGALKISSAILLMAGIWVPQLVLPVSSLVSSLMVGAILMHLKIRDPLIKSLPALLMLILGLSIILMTA